MNNIREDMLTACRWLQKEGMIIGTWGNVSVRQGDRIIITPSRIDYDVMEFDDFVEINLAGDKMSGRNVPSSEKDVHRLIYLQREDVGAVVHNHSLYASTVAVLGKNIPPLIEEMSQLLGGAVPCTSNYVPAGHHMELAEEAARTIGDKNGLLLKNHGCVCCGKDLKEALLACQVVEKAARIFVTISTLPTTGPVAGIIDDNFVREERHRYLYSYGK